MRFKTFLFPAFVLLLLSAFGCNEADTAPKMTVAVVDSTRAFQESKAGKDGVAYLDEVGKEMQAELVKLQEATVKDDSDASRAALQKGFGELQQRFGAEQQQVMNKVTDAYQKALDSLRDKEGLTVILASESAVSFAPQADVTSKVIELMNATPIVFERVQPENAGSDSPDAAVPPAGNGTRPSGNATQQ